VTSKPQPFRLGILDQSPVSAGSSAAEALSNTIDLARHCDRLGYHRYWVAEHHNSNGLAGPAPEILVGQIAAATSQIRVGAGGVMLSHYSPLKVAETFRILEALHPGRIDLGVGRAPGSDPMTMYALANNRQPNAVEAYPAMVEELLGFLNNDLPEDNPFRGKVAAVPAAVGEPPPVWLLASSPDSASFAAHFGLPLSYAHFFGLGDGVAIVDTYRRNFKQSVWFDQPVVSIGVAVICAETDEAAQQLATSVTLWRERGLTGPIPTVQESEGQVGLGAGSAGVPGRKPMVVGSPETVRNQIQSLAQEYRADEVLAVTIVWDHQARVRSYELLAEAFGLETLSVLV